MRRSLLLALWSVGALGGPCKPARDLTHNHYDLPSAAPSTYLTPTQSSQDTAAETHTAGGSDGGDEEVSVPIHSTGSFTQGSGSHTVGIPGNSVTADPVFASDTTTADGELPEASQASDAAGVPGAPSGGAELTESASTTGVPTSASDQPGGEATGTETSVIGGGDATQLPEAGTGTDIASQPSSDAGNTVFPSSDGSSLADGVAATETATNLPGETSGPGDNSETTVDGAAPTQQTPGITPGTVSPGEPSSDVTGSAPLTGEQPEATKDATDNTSDVPAATQGADSTETGSPGSPDQTIPVPGNTATGTEQGQDTSADFTQTASGEPVGSGDVTSPTPTNVGSDNTEAATAGTGNISQDIPETTGAGPEQTPLSTEQSQDNSPNEATASGSDNNSAPAAEPTTVGVPPTETDNATQPTTDVEDVTTKPADDTSDISSVEVSSDNDGPSTAVGVTTSHVAAITGGNDNTPSTTAPNGNGPSITLNPAPVTTTAPGATAFPTITEVPEGFAPSTVSGHPEWTSNTWITTTSGDSSEPTIVPILVGCKKCGGSGSGIILWGFPKVTDTWFKLPGPPKFTFPCIPPGCTTPPTTSESNSDDGDDDEDDDDESSTTCTDKATVTDCFVACTTYTGPAGETITPDCSTTCTATHTGCSVTGTTTTSSAAACGPSGDTSCQTCKRKLVSTTDPDFLERRGLDLEKRGERKGPNKIAGCPKFGVMPEFPEYPGGETVLNNEEDIIPKGSPLKDIKKWWLTTIDNQCLPLLRGNLDAATYKNDASGADSDRPSIDHVYEKSMLLDFFRAIIDKNAPNVKGATTGNPRDKISCSDMEAYGGATKKSKKKLLQKVFDAYPGSVANKQNAVMINNTQYFDDFIGMDQWTNGDAKGFVATSDQVKSQSIKWVDGKYDIAATTNENDAYDWIEKKLDLLEKLAIGIEMFSAPEAIEAMIRQNQRIYARLMDIDTEAKGCMNDPAVKNGLWSFAKAYQKFMETRFEGQDSWSINNEVGAAKTKLLTKLTEDLKQAPSVKATSASDWTDSVAVWNRRLTNMADFNRQWAVPEPAWVWTWIKKRDGEDSGLSCDRPIPSDTTSMESTTFATSTRTSSEESSEESTSAEKTTSSKEETSSSEDMVTSTTEGPIRLTDLPTLTNVPELSISTPDGSSCASTATYTQCNLGTGHHGDACVKNSECASWVNTKTTSTTPTPTPTLTMASPDPGQNVKHCYDSGQKSSYGAITAAAESFCRDVVSKNKDNGYYWSNDKLEGKKLPSTGYHFKLLFSVNEGCLWKADFDECMRYMKVPIDSCDCEAQGNKQGGWVETNCITAKIDPNSGT